jgi:hypothetical protein
MDRKRRLIHGRPSITGRLRAGQPPKGETRAIRSGSSAASATAAS